MTTGERHSPGEEPVDERALGILEVLYGERSDAELDADQKTEVAELRELRQLFTGLPDAEPPARISSQLLAAAAAEARPARAHRRSQELRAQTPWWRRFLLPLTAHPGLTAAASLIVLIGVAGALYVKGNLSAESTSPNLMVHDEPAGAEVAAPEEVTGAAESAEINEVEAKSDESRDLELDDLAQGYVRDNAPAAKGKDKPKPTLENAPRAPAATKAAGTRAAPQDRGKSARTVAGPAQDLLTRARSLASDGECNRAIKVIEEIRRTDPQLYRTTVRKDKALARCRAVVERSKKPTKPETTTATKKGKGDMAVPPLETLKK